MLALVLSLLADALGVVQKVDDLRRRKGEAGSRVYRPTTEEVARYSQPEPGRKRRGRGSYDLDTWLLVALGVAAAIATAGVVMPKRKRHVAPLRKEKQTR